MPVFARCLGAASRGEAGVEGIGPGVLARGVAQAEGLTFFAAQFLPFVTHTFDITVVDLHAIFVGGRRRFGRSGSSTSAGTGCGHRGG